MSDTPVPVVVAAASSGGLQALSTIVSQLPADFPGAVIVVQHRSPTVQSQLVPILRKRSRLSVEQAYSGGALERGTIYIARPDRHLSVGEDGRFHYSDGHRIRRVMSSANPLFESVAERYGPSVIGLVLTGVDSDGTDGVQAIKQHGGTVIVQDRATSEHYDMPQSAVRTGAVDQVLPLDMIAPALVRLAKHHRADHQSTAVNDE